MDHESATRGLHELRQHYLDTIAKIRDDVLDHVHQTKASAAKKIRSAKSNFASRIQKHVMQISLRSHSSQGEGRKGGLLSDTDTGLNPVEGRTFSKLVFSNC